MIRFKSLIWGFLLVVLIISLVATTCVQEAPETGDRKPAKVQEWEPATWAGAGLVWDGLVYLSQLITEESGGRIVVTPTLPDAICPVDEQLDYVASGATECMVPYPGYYGGKNPVFLLQGSGFVAAQNPMELAYLVSGFEGGRLEQVLRQAYADYGDVYYVGNVYRRADAIMSTKIPVRKLDDVKGMMFRTSELLALTLAHFGAGTVWAPGPEIYTMLATGAVEGVTFENAAMMYAMGFSEVTKYWVKEPILAGPDQDSLVVNGTVWKSLDEDLQKIVADALGATTWHNIVAAEIEINEAWVKVAQEGIEIVTWPEEDGVRWYQGMWQVLNEEYRGKPGTEEVFEIYEDFLKYMGRLKS